MKKIQKTTWAITIIVAAFSIMVMASEFGIGVSAERANNVENAAVKAELNTLKQVTWEVSSNSDVKVAVVAMGLSRVIQVKPGFSLVVANEGYAATDFGPTSRLFLVYHSKSEMPHYEATFFLGNIHSVKSVKPLDASLLQIDLLLHARLSKASEVRLLVDLSELNNVMEAPPENEGNLDVSVNVTVSEMPK